MEKSRPVFKRNEITGREAVVFVEHCTKFIYLYTIIFFDIPEAQNQLL